MLQGSSIYATALALLVLSACNSGGGPPSTEDTSQLCGILSACCTLLDTQMPAPGCATVAASRNGTLCGLGLEGIQAQTIGLQVILTTNGGQCGTPSGETSIYPGIIDPACIALKACSTTLPSDEKATAQLGYYLDEDGPCTSALAYFKSQEECASVAYDAGTWSGLLPLQGDGTSGMQTGSASHSAH